MPTIYDPATIKQFFGTEGELGETEVIGRSIWIDYSGPVLQYWIILNLDAESVFISGRPPGAAWVYELSVPCSEIESGPDPYARDDPERISLRIYYGGKDYRPHLRMRILKVSNGELLVWPEYPFPPGHVFCTDGKG
jgi:hypothetical protein